MSTQQQQQNVSRLFDMWQRGRISFGDIKEKTINYCKLCGIESIDVFWRLWGELVFAA